MLENCVGKFIDGICKMWEEILMKMLKGCIDLCIIIDILCYFLVIIFYFRNFVIELLGLVVEVSGYYYLLFKDLYICV